jgi:hypothetical protein
MINVGNDENNDNDICKTNPSVSCAFFGTNYNLCNSENDCSFINGGCTANPCLGKDKFEFVCPIHCIPSFFTLFIY